MQTKYLSMTLAALLTASALTSNICFADETDDIDVFSELEESIGEEQKSLISFHKDIYCAVDGKAVNISGCVMKEDRVYVPIKPIFEAMGFTVTYAPKIKQVGLVQGETKILLDLNKGVIVGTLYADGKSVDINAVLDDNVELSGAVYIPIRNITENMYCQVDWKQENNTVYIQSPSLKDVTVEQKDTVDVSQYIGDNSTMYFEDIMPVILKISATSDFKQQITLIDSIVAEDAQSNIEIETSRVFNNFKSKMLALYALNDKPTYNENTSWMNEAYQGYDTYRASAVELQRLSDRLLSEGILSDAGAGLVTKIINDIKTKAFA